eukprot:GEMP01035336.1.p1 GENE.GEMP01035336.1~~GEMP01035336.1.p1  ORF type:complete len:130 (+),score=14.27 GEMP01035336.1:106-495(+)
MRRFGQLASRRYFSSAPNVRLSKDAVKHLCTLRDKGMSSTLRLKVNSGGCSGFEYDFQLLTTDQELTPDDLISEDKTGARLVVDATSNSLLEDCEVDYKQEMIRASFQVTKNKLADQNCSCGSSFSISF